MGKKNKDIEAQKLKTPVPKAQNPEKPLSLPSKKIQKAKKLKQPNPNPIKNNEKQLNPQGNSSKTNQKTNKSNKKASKSKQLIKTVQKVESIEKNIEIEALTDEYSIYIKEKLAKLDSMKVEIKAGLSLDNKLIKKAISALLEYNDRTRNPKNLLDTNEGFIYVELSFSKLPEHYSIRPIQIKLPNPIYTEEQQSRFGIIVTDPQRQFKDKIQNLNIPLIGKVIGYSKLIKKHPTYEDKRKLCNSFDYFFCDYRLYELLRKPTGKIFYSRKKIPFPIDTEKVPEYLEPLSYEAYLNDLSKYTYFMMGNGPVYTFKPARVSMGKDQIVENIIEGIENVLGWILDCGLKLRNLEQIDLKLFNSVSLPIYNHLTKKDIKAYLSC